MPFFFLFFFYFESFNIVLSYIIINIISTYFHLSHFFFVIGRWDVRSFHNTIYALISHSLSNVISSFPFPSLFLNSISSSLIIVAFISLSYVCITLRLLISPYSALCTFLFQLCFFLIPCWVLNTLKKKHLFISTSLITKHIYVILFILLLSCWCLSYEFKTRTNGWICYKNLL